MGTENTIINVIITGKVCICKIFLHNTYNKFINLLSCDVNRAIYQKLPSGGPYSVVPQLGSPLLKTRDTRIGRIIANSTLNTDCGLKPYLAYFFGYLHNLSVKNGNQTCWAWG